MNWASGDVLGLGPGFDPVDTPRVEHSQQLTKSILFILVQTRRFVASSREMRNVPA